MVIASKVCDKLAAAGEYFFAVFLSTKHDKNKGVWWLELLYCSTLLYASKQTCSNKALFVCKRFADPCLE